MRGTRRTEPRISAIEYRFDRSSFGWELRAASYAGGPVKTVDYLRTQSAAEYAARELAAGRAHIEPHRPVGCRVQPGAAR
jgi:hypothetical protein